MPVWVWVWVWVWGPITLFPNQRAFVFGVGSQRKPLLLAYRRGREGVRVPLPMASGWYGQPKLCIAHMHTIPSPPPLKDDSMTIWPLTNPLASYSSHSSLLGSAQLDLTRLGSALIFFFLLILILNITIIKGFKRCLLSYSLILQKSKRSFLNKFHSLQVDRHKM